MGKKKELCKTLTWLNMGCYPGYTLFIHNFTVDEVLAQLKKRKSKDWYQGVLQNRTTFDSANFLAIGTELLNDKTGESVKLYYIMLKKEFDFSDYHYSVLAHEVLHICQFYLPAILDRNREYEAEAYLHTHLMTQCLKAIRRKAKK